MSEGIGDEMKANGRFFGFSTIFNLILGAIAALLLLPVRAYIVLFIVLAVVFAAIAMYVNFFIVKRSKLKIPYFIFGTAVNIVVCAGLMALILLLK